MYALFPEQARSYLSKHRTSEKTVYLMQEESSATKEEDYVDINQIRELVKMVEASGVGEVTVEEAGTKITVRAAGMTAAPVAAAPVAASPVASAPTAAPVVADSRPTAWKAVVSPMVGTFYSSPAPDAAPFVKVGDKVMAGQSLCIVEAMKLMNEIPAEEMGIIREICLDNSDSVEYGTPLFYLEPVADEPATAGMEA